MDSLEREVTAIANGPIERRATLPSFAKLAQLIHVLVDTAEGLLGDGNDAGHQNAFVFLERAESWCDYVSDFVAEPLRNREVKLESSSAHGDNAGASSSAAAVSSAPLWLHAAHCKLRAYGALRDAYRRGGVQWNMCLAYAEKVDAVNRLIAREWTAQANGSSTEEARAQRDAAAVAVGRSTLGIGGLLSKLGRHNSALDKTRFATQVLDAAVQSIAEAHAMALCTDNDALVARLKAELVSAAAVHVAALYSTGSELEHLERPAEAAVAYRAGLHAATVTTPLPPQHPLIAKLHEALTAFQPAHHAGSATPASTAGGSVAPSAGVRPSARSGLVKGSAADAKASTGGILSARSTSKSNRPVAAKQPASARKPPRPTADDTADGTTGAPAPPLHQVAPPRTADPAVARPVVVMPAPPPRLYTAPAPSQQQPTANTAAPGAAFQRQHIRSQLQQPAAAAAGAAAAVKSAPGGALLSTGDPITIASKLSLGTEVNVSVSSTHGADRRPLFPSAQQMPPLLQQHSTIAHWDDSVEIPAHPQPSTSASLLVPDASLRSRSVQGRTPGAGTTVSAADRHAKAAKRQKQELNQSMRSVQDAMRDRELEMRRRYLLWADQATRPIVDEHNRRQRAALRIQCAWRCARARLEVFNRRQCLYHFVHAIQKRAARAILTCYRTHVAERRRRDSIEANKRRRAEIAQREQRQRDAVLVILRYMHAMVRRRRRAAELMRLLKLEQEAKLRQYDTAAVIVQRWWPIAKQQRTYWRNRNQELMVLKQIEAERYRRQFAATNISRMFRGFITRRQARIFREQELERKRALQTAIRASIDVIRIFLKEVRARKERRQLEADLELKRRSQAASVIQGSWTRSLQREHMRLVSRRGRLIRASAAKIQRCYRRFRARRDLRVMRTVSKTHNLIRIEREWKQERAVRKIQCAWRQHLARRAVRRIKASFGRRLLLATWLIQRCCRGYAARTEVGMDRALQIALFERAVLEAQRRRDARVTLLQSHARAHLSIQMGLRLKESVEAEELLIIRRTRREMFEDREATKIQKIARGRQGRVKAEVRRELVEQSAAMVLRAVIRLQCFFRKTLAVRNLHARQVVAWKARRKRELQAEVAAELFVQRSEEMMRLEAATRSALMAKERSRTLGLVSHAARLGWPSASIAAIAVGSYGSGGASTSATPVDEDDGNHRLRQTFAAPPIDFATRVESLVRAEQRQRSQILEDEVQSVVYVFAVLQPEAPVRPMSADTPAPTGAEEGVYDVRFASKAAVPQPPARLVADISAPSGAPAAEQPLPEMPHDDDYSDLLAAPPAVAKQHAATAISVAPQRDAFDAFYDAYDDDDDENEESGLYD